MNQRLPLWKPYAALVAVYLIWGTTAGFIRLGVDTIPSALLPCLRFSIAGLLLLGFCLLRGEKWPDARTLKTHFIIGMLLFFGGNSIVCWTVQYMSTSFGGILIATTPLWMVWLSAILPPREQVPLLSVVGILIGFSGMLVLLAPQLMHLETTSPVFWACVAGLGLMSFCWALGSIYARKHPTPTSLLMNVGLQNLFAGLALIPICFFSIQDWSAIHPSSLSLTALAYLIGLGTISATPCYLYVVQTLPVSISSTFAYVTPVITIIFGWLFLGESITPNMIVGASVIMAGVILVQYINRHYALKLSAVTVRAQISPGQPSTAGVLPATGTQPNLAVVSGELEIEAPLHKTPF